MSFLLTICETRGNIFVRVQSLPPPRSHYATVSRNVHFVTCVAVRPLFRPPLIPASALAPHFVSLFVQRRFNHLRDGDVCAVDATKEEGGRARRAFGRRQPAERMLRREAVRRRWWVRRGTRPHVTLGTREGRPRLPPFPCREYDASLPKSGVVSCLFVLWQMSRFAHRSSFLIAQALPSPHFVWANLRHYDCDCVPRTRKRVSVLLRLCLSRSRSATNLPTGRGTLIGSNPGPCGPFRAPNQDRRCKIQFPLSGRERGRKGIEPPDETPHQIR